MKLKTPPLPWPDLLIASAGALLVGAIAAGLDLHERLYEFSRRWEGVQIDEVWIAVMVFSVVLLLLHGRRFRQAQQELAARREAEAALSRALAENRELAQAYVVAQEVERKRLARELHDELGQYLVAIKLEASRVTVDASDDNAIAAERITACVDHMQGAASDMIRRLRPVGLDELGLNAALEHGIDQWRRRQPEVDVDVELDPRVDGLGEARDLVIYRVIQEALTNATRHARASHVHVRISREAREVRVEVRDDGVGFHDATATEGFGLRGMRERLVALGGSLRVVTSPGNGVAIEATLPMEAA